MHLYRSFSNIPRPPSFLEILKNPYVLLTFDKVHNPLRLPREVTSERPKVIRIPDVFNILISKCSLYHIYVYFFDIVAFKNVPNMICFVYVNFEMNFALQSPVLFRHRNFQKWSEYGIFLIFRFRNTLRIITALYFFDILISKNSEHEVFLVFFTCKYTSRHNGVYFFDIVIFDFEMCFALQRHAFFGHLNFQKVFRIRRFC